MRTLIHPQLLVAPVPSVSHRLILHTSLAAAPFLPVDKNLLLSNKRIYIKITTCSTCALRQLFGNA